MTELWILLGILVNVLVGAGVWVAIDMDGRLLKWFEQAPLAAITQPLILSAWPIGLWFWWRLKVDAKRDAKKDAKKDA